MKVKAEYSTYDQGLTSAVLEDNSLLNSTKYKLMIKDELSPIPTLVLGVTQDGDDALLHEMELHLDDVKALQLLLINFSKQMILHNKK